MPLLFMQLIKIFFYKNQQNLTKINNCVIIKVLKKKRSEEKMNMTIEQFIEYLHAAKGYTIEEAKEMAKIYY